MRRAILSVSFFNFFSAGLAFLINIFFARYFSVDVYGRINLLLSFTLIINTIGDFGFSNTNVIFTNKFKDEYSFEKLTLIVNYFYKKYLIWILISCLVLVLVFNFLYELTYLENIFLFFQGGVISFFRFLLSFHQAYGNWNKFNLINVSLNIFKFLFLAACFVVPFFTIEENLISYNLVLVILSAACFLSFVLSFIYSFRYLKIKVKTPEIKGLNEGFKRILIPLIGINVVIVFAMRSDSLIIQKYLGENALGIYSAANSLALVFPLITNSIMQVLLKEASNKGIDYLRRIIELQKKHFLFIVLVLIGVELLSYYLIPIVFGQEYESSVKYFQVLILAHLGGLIFTPLESYFYSKKTNLIFMLKCIQLSIIIIIPVIFVSSYGLLIMVLSVLLSRVVGWIILYNISINKLKQME
ncbi:lipopolysaccharide biosynthesis protein [Aquimarina sp. I32.4]|uniref:lipopolysaccharide biosynthesis protein n=1 Tax=Aquimarina sp. I32.4 TaxID=2053903 RepID=UPI000CDEB7BA|nr:oligosaccharide flippase family protein [Aquimarina sp. I32.4]